MQQPSLLQRAKSAAPAFQRPDIKPFIPEGQQDAVDRIVAAGMKIMYSPDAKEEVMQAMQADEPVGQKLGTNVAGLLMMLDKEAPKGLPAEAIFPAGFELLGEAADMLQAAGITVTHDDYAEGARMVVALMARQLGATDDQIMGELSKHVGGGQGAMPPEQPGQDETLGGPEQAEMPADEQQEMP